MFVESLSLTTQGLAALQSAPDGGVFIRPVSCELGNFEGDVPAEVPQQLLGDMVCKTSVLRYIEVLSNNVARFSFEIPANIPDTTECRVTEALLRLADDIPFAYVKLQYPIYKYYGNAHRISFLLYTNGETDLHTVIDVSISEHVSLPQVSSVNWLPPAGQASYSTVLVADLVTVADNSRVPGLALRSGFGGSAWSFPGFSRVFCEPVADRALGNGQYRFDDLSIDKGTAVILSLVSGIGAGYCRAGVFNGSMITVDTEFADFPAMSPSTVMAVWIPQQLTGGSTGQVIVWPAESEDIPENWVLVRGEGASPYWAPPSNVGATAQGVVLYDPPSKLVLKTLVTTATPDQLRYELPYEVDVSSEVLLTIGGVFQPTSAFDVQEDFLDLSEAVPENMQLSARTLIREPSQGHALSINVITVTGDGSLSEVDVGADITDVEQVMLVVQNIFNSVTSYTVSEGKLRFTEPLPSGMVADIYCMRHTQSIGTMTKVHTASWDIDYPKNDFPLPVIPVSKSYVLVIDSGTVMMQNNFSIIDGVLYTNSKIPAGRNLQVFVLSNSSSGGSPDRSLEGVITHAYPTNYGMKFLRHGKKPIDVPLPRPVIRGKDGIVIDESKFPLITVSYDASKDPNAAKATGVMTLMQAADDTEEVQIIQRITLAGDVSLMAVADFDAQLGPGFSSEDKRERIDCLITVLAVGDSLPSFGTGAKGSGSAGFTAYSESDSQAIAYANRHCNISAELLLDNHPAKAVDVVAKMRVVNGKVSTYGSHLSINLSIMTAR